MNSTDNDLYTHQSLQQKPRHPLWFVTFPQLWSIFSPLPLSLKTLECPHKRLRRSGHLINKINNDWNPVKIIFSPTRRTLLFSVTTRIPNIGLGRAPPGTSLHSPAEGRYTSVEARRLTAWSTPPVTSNTWIWLKECFLKIWILPSHCHGTGN